jgi:hypothetical protein
MIVSHGVEDDPRFSLRSPEFQIRFDGPRHDRFFDHRHDSLVMGRLTDPFQFLVFADLVGPFSFGQASTEFGKQGKPFFPQKKAVDPFGVNITKGLDGIKAADGEFIGELVVHDELYHFFRRFDTIKHGNQGFVP